MYIPTPREQYYEQGKSNSFLVAQAEGKLTAGQAAKVLSRRLGVPVKAQDIEPLAVEFHHAGAFGGGKAKRVYFFTQEELAHITLEDIERAKSPRWGWKLGFQKNVRRWVPIIEEVRQFSGSEIKRLGDKFHPIQDDEVPAVKERIGWQLPPYCSDWRKAQR